MTQPSKRSGRMVELAVESIRNRIVDLTLKPGEHINDKWLMETFRLSRTPTREALNRLVAEGLVDIVPNHGAFVHKLDLSEIEQLFKAYQVSERLAAFYCDFSDPELVPDVVRFLKEHRAAVKDGRFVDVTRWFAASRTRIARTSGNAYVFRFCERMNTRMRRLSYYAYLIESRDRTFGSERLRVARGHHREIQDALRRANRFELVDVCERQVTIFRERVGRAVIQNHWNAFPLEGSGESSSARSDASAKASRRSAR